MPTPDKFSIESLADSPTWDDLPTVRVYEKQADGSYKVTNSIWTSDKLMSGSAATQLFDSASLISQTSNAVNLTIL